MTNKRATYVIQDPYDDDAIAFIQAMYLYFALRPLCIYTDPKARFYGEQQFPLLTSDLIEERIDISGRALSSVCDELLDRYDIRAVIPFREDTVEIAAELCGLLELDWNDEETLARFRDKFEQKRFVAEQDPTVRVPESRIVENLADVWDVPPPSRFVIKPNDGLGNQRIGIFDDSETDKIAAHVNSTPPTTWILEEFIGGTEFHVNGQVRRNGEVTILAIFEYMRVEVNNYPTVYQGELQVRSDDPRFAEIASYSRRLLEATKLRGCPFHLEVKVDEHGPCLIDLGARFPSDGGSRIVTNAHPDRPDVIAVAAHDYLGDNNFAMEPLDFTYGDEHPVVIVYGISRTAEIIGELEGVETVEQMPEFVGWVVKPRIGDDVSITQDLRGAPFIAQLRHQGDHNESRRLITLVQDTIRWNHGSGRRASVRGNAQKTYRRASQKIRWTAASTAKKLTSGR